jgi:hypothetical protein
MMALLLQQLSYWVLQLGLIPLCFSKILAIECPDFQSMTSPVLQHKRSAPADSAGFQALTNGRISHGGQFCHFQPQFRFTQAILWHLTVPYTR